MKIKVLAFIGILCLFFTNCKKGELNKPEIEKVIDFPADDYYSEELQVFDESGKYSITMIVVAKDEETFSKHIDNWVYELNILLPSTSCENVNGLSESEYGNENTEESGENINDIYTIIEEVNIPENAKGFSLEVSAKSGSHLKTAWASSQWYHGPKWYHHAKATWKPSSNSNNAIGVYWYTQYSITAAWTQKEFIELNSTTEVDEFSYSNYRIRVKIYHNWNNYGIQFKHWEADDWGSDENP